MAKEIKFRVKLSIDGKEQLVTATSSVADLRAALDGVQSASRKAQTALFDINQAVLAVGNASAVVSQISGTLNSVTEESRAFGAAMNAANTMAGKGSEDFARLKDEVADLAKTLPVARDELAGGLYQVISNGVPEDNWITYLRQSARASVGGIADLGETVKVTSTIIKNYGLSWDDAGRVQDKIQLTAKNGVTSFEQLAQALPRVTGNAATLGVSIDELMATFATLTGVSGNTAEVSTQLAAVFTALVKPSSEATKMAQQMGIAFDAAAIKAAGGMRNFLVQLDAEVKAYAARSGMLEQEIYGKLFGSAESLRALGPLTGQLAAKFGENVEAMKGSAGTIDAAFATMSSSSSATLQKLKNTVADVTDGIATAFGFMMPALNITAQVGNSVVAVLALHKTLAAFATVQRLAAATTAVTTTATRAWNTATVTATAVQRLLAATLHGTAVGATTARVAMVGLRAALQGLLVATGIGIALVALTEGLTYFIGKAATAEDAAGSAAEGMNGLGAAVQTTADRLRAQKEDALAPVLAKYEQLREAWKGLKTEQAKNEFIKANTAAFGQLGVGIDSVAQAESFFVGNTSSVVAALNARAEAAAAAAIAEEKMKEALRAEGEAKKMNKGNRQNYIARHRTGHAAQDLAMEQLVNEGAIRVTSNGQRAAEQRAKEARRDAGAMNRLAAAAGRKATQGLRGYRGTMRQPTAAPGSGSGTSAGTGRRTSQAGRAEAPAAKGSLDWYEKRLGDLRKKIYAAGDTGVAQAMRQEYEALEAELKQRKIQIGIEQPEKTEAKTYVETLRDRLAAAEHELDDAVTVAARVEASAKVDAIQAEIDAATRGRLTIEAEAEPTFVTQGSDADKRRSRANAETAINRVQNDYEIGLIGADEAMRQMQAINDQLQQLGLKPVAVKLDGSDLEKKDKDIRDAADAVGQLGGSLAGLGDAIGVPEMNVAGVMAQAIATMVSGYATATSQSATLGPWAWVAFAAAGLAQLSSMVSAVKGMSAYATGGVVGGTSTHGDKKFVRVNSGEMILNKFQQARLFQLVNGGFQPPAFADRSMQDVTFNNVTTGMQPAMTDVNITLGPKLGKMLDVLSKEAHLRGTTGKRITF